MNSEWTGLIEMGFTFGVVLLLALVDYIKTKRDGRNDRDE
jgi:hypothetical protein